MNEATSSRTIGQKNIYFHGRHIFSSVLRHLVTNFFLDKAEEIVLVGSGNKIKLLQWFQRLVRKAQSFLFTSDY